jgi:neutral trehalase
MNTGSALPHSLEVDGPTHRYTEGNGTAAAQFSRLAQTRQAAMQRILWNATQCQWVDYSITEQHQVRVCVLLPALCLTI